MIRQCITIFRIGQIDMLDGAISGFRSAGPPDRIHTLFLTFFPGKKSKGG